jgi:hypothetical protein
MPGSTLDQTILDLLDGTLEVDAKTPRSDGSTSSRPIWVVVTGGEAYVRSYRGPGGAWYRRAKTEGRLTLVADDTEIAAAVEPATDDDVNQRVSDAYREKYGERSPGSTETMVDPEVSQTTLRLAQP